VRDSITSKAKLRRELAGAFILEAEKTLQKRLVSACLFGSTARENAEQSSDIDILLIAEDLPEGLISRNRTIKNIQETIRSSAPAQALKKMGQSTLISPIMFTLEEASKHPPIMLDIVDDGIILHDRDEFLQGILNDIRRRLKELRARKVKTQKGWYWILKPDAKLGEEVRI
jgi:predicted nucleotidyltransferase